MLSIEERVKYKEYCKCLSEDELRKEINNTADGINYSIGEARNNEFVRLSIAQKVLEERGKKHD